MKIRTIGLVAALTGATLVTSCGEVRVGPPPPKVALLNVCYIPGAFLVQYTYEAFGDGWYRLRSAAGTTPATYRLYGEVWNTYGIGDSQVEWTSYPNDDSTWLNAVDGYRPAQPTPDCPQGVKAQ